MANTVNSYKDKYMGVDNRLSVMEILQKVGTTEYREGVIKEYEAVDIAEVKIDGNRFRNYGVYSFIWEKTFVKSPERSANGSIGNLNSYATFLTPHLILDFSVMSIDDYRRIMLLHYGANEYTVECYDPIYNRKINVKMYFGTEEMAKLYTIAQNRLLPNGQWEEWVDLVGVTEYKVELIGTNNDLDLVSVIYHLNPPANTGYADETVGEEDVYNGEDIVIGGSASSITSQTFGGTYKFKNWNLSSLPSDINKGVYINGNVYTINTSIVLYAQWQATTEHILSYNYGLADPAINDSDYVYITNKTVAYGQSIGNLPTAQTPTVKAKNINGVEREYSPYYNPQWWKVPQKVTKLDENGNDITSTLIVGGNEPYWSHRDSSIYLLYDTKTYDLVLKILNTETNAFETYQENLNYQGKGIAYNTPMNLPLLVKSNYSFDGWYYTSDFEEGTKVSGNMPPYYLTLYARWVAK